MPLGRVIEGPDCAAYLPRERGDTAALVAMARRWRLALYPDLDNTKLERRRKPYVRHD